MSDFEFERENQEAFKMVRENHRRSNLTETVGCIVPVDQAMEFVQFRASRKKSDGVGGIILTVVMVLGILAATVAAFL